MRGGARKLIGGKTLKEGGGARVSMRATASAVGREVGQNGVGSKATMCVRETSGAGEIVVSGLTTMTQLQEVEQAKAPASPVVGWTQRISRLPAGLLQQQ